MATRRAAKTPYLATCFAMAVGLAFIGSSHSVADERTPATSASASQGNHPVISRSYTSTFLGLFDDIADIKIDMPTRRIFVSFRAQNLVEVFSFEGSPLGSISVARPGQMTAIGNDLFVLSESEGTIVRINTQTLAPTVVVSGLNRPSGLTSVEGNLFTSAYYPANQPFDAESFLLRLDPASGSVTPVFRVFRLSFYDPSPLAPYVFGATEYPRSAVTYRRLNSQGPLSFESLSGDFICHSRLDNGEVLLGNQTPVAKFAAYNVATMTPSLRVWTLPSSDYAAACGAGEGYVAIISGKYGSAGFDVTTLSQNSFTQVARQVIADDVPERGLSRVSDDSSIIVVTSYNTTLGTLRIHILPGVQPRKAAPASMQAEARPRTVA
jgi:hypothetical protein